MAARTETLKSAVEAWTFFNSDEGLRALAIGRLKAKRLFDNELAAEIEEKEAERRRADLAVQEKEAEKRRADFAVQRADLAVQEKEAEKRRADLAVQEKEAEVKKHQAEMTDAAVSYRNLLLLMLENRFTDEDYQIIQEKISEISDLNRLQQIAAKIKRDYRY